MVFMDGVREFVEDDIVTKLLWESHQLDIETDSIPMATTPPSGFLMTK